jgi:hypothetical protein
LQTHEKALGVVIALTVVAVLALPSWWPLAAPYFEPSPIATSPTVPPASEPGKAQREPIPPHDPSQFARHLATAHYTIDSNATGAQTQRAADALEALHAAWSDAFAAYAHPRPENSRLTVALYRDRADFRAHNTSYAWAQGFYRLPVCHAYFDAEATNPLHWLVHEATHQLDTEVARFPRTPWVEEGLASYYGTSRLVDGQLHPGDTDPGAYPVRWLGRAGLSGDRQRDFARRRLVPLRELIESDGPVAPSDVNPYYIGYWSLAHYLLHGDGGRHADAFRAMVVEGGSLEQFERRVGPVEKVEAAWYAHLLRQAAVHRTQVAR